LTTRSNLVNIMATLQVNVRSSLLVKSAKIHWGLKHEALTRIYNGVILPLLLKVAPVWIKALKYDLTFRRLASYPVGRHLNISALLEVLASRSLGHPQPQPFKYFPLNIFREISLILSTKLEVFPASCSD